MEAGIREAETGTDTRSTGGFPRRRTSKPTMEDTCWDRFRERLEMACISVRPFYIENRCN
jgi:hypothetical protein